MQQPCFLLYRKVVASATHLWRRVSLCKTLCLRMLINWYVLGIVILTIVC